MTQQYLRNVSLVVADPTGKGMELDRTAWRRLDPALRQVDSRLQRWAHLARPLYVSRGLPLRPGAPGVKAAVRMTRDAWPAHVRAVDDIVLSLNVALASAVLAHYCAEGQQSTGSLAIVYRQLLAHFGKTTAKDARGFRDNLDRGRWTLWAALRLVETKTPP